MKLYVEYNETVISERNDVWGDGDWSRQVDFEIRGVSENKPTQFLYDEFNVCFDQTSIVYVLYIRYDTGDSFGCSHGEGEIIWVFSELTFAKEAAATFREHEDEFSVTITDEHGNNITLSNPAAGYFQQLTEVVVEKFHMAQHTDRVWKF